MKKILAVVMIVIVVVIGIIAFLYAEQGMFHVDVESGNDLSTEQDTVSTDEIEEANLLTERGTALADEEAENLYITDISDEDWDAIDDSIEGICLIIEEYSDEDGYVNPDDTDTVLNAVTEQVSKLYNDGIVTYYKCNSDVISFEFSSGLMAYYEPVIEGYLAGAEEDFVNIITLDPWDKDIGSPWAAIWGANISVSLDNREILNLINDNESKGVMLEDLKNLPASEFFFWFGHGGCGSDGTTLHLATAQSYTDRSGIEDINAKMVAVGISGFGVYWAIEPEFVTKFITLDDGLVYLAACYTGKNDSFADAFNDVGAETVFVNAGDDSAQTFYTINMMGFILKYMSSRGDGIYRTAEEALSLANEDFDAWFTGNSNIEVQYGKNRYSVAMALAPYNSLDDYTNGVQNGTHIEYRGEGDYTICSCIRGKVDFGDNMTQDEISKILSYLSVNLVSEDGIYIDSVSVNDDSTFYFNDLDPDSTYMMTLQRGNSQIGETITVTTEKHRYVSALLTYSAIVLTGYVYDESVNPLENVSVTISEVEVPINIEYNYVVCTDEDGYYSVSVADGLSYALTYEKDGYVTVETLYYPTDEHEAGENIKLEDIDLEQMKLMGTVVDAETGEVLSGATVAASRDDALEKYITVSGTTDSSGAFAISVATEGDYNVTFGLEGYESVTVSAAMVQGSHTDMGTISLTVSDDETMIPDDAFEWNGHYYYIYSDVCDTWEEAVEYCESLGGYLAVISSESENAVLFEYVNESGLRNGGVYFGYTDNITEGEWYWVSEEASSYTNWASNEPNSENNSENYAEFYYKYTDGNWNDGDFASKRIICEWNLVGE